MKYSIECNIQRSLASLQFLITSTTNWNERPNERLSLWNKLQFHVVNYALQITSDPFREASEVYFLFRLLSIYCMTPGMNGANTKTLKKSNCLTLFWFSSFLQCKIKSPTARSYVNQNGTDTKGFPEWHLIANCKHTIRMGTSPFGSSQLCR